MEVPPGFGLGGASRESVLPSEVTPRAQPSSGSGVYPPGPSNITHARDTHAADAAESHLYQDEAGGRFQQTPLGAAAPRSPA